MEPIIARGPLVDRHRSASATLAIVDGWEVAVRYPGEPAAGGDALVDLSHRQVHELNGPLTDERLRGLRGSDVPVRTIHRTGTVTVYRLTQARALVFDAAPEHADALDVTGGWATFALFGPHAADLLAKMTAVDLRPSTLPSGACCQGPIFGVVTLFGRFEDRFELHVASDAAEFVWEVLLDAGAQFDLRPAGLEYGRK